MLNSIVVLIPTAGRARLLQRTLASLAACPQPPSYRETIVVENGPKGDVERVTAEFAGSLRARYVYVPEPNKSHALNVALASLANDCLVFFTDDDVRFAPTLLMEYAAVGAQHGPGSFFGGPMAVDYEAPPPAWLLPHLPASARGWQPGPAEANTLWTVFLGCNWAAWVCDLRRAGPFDVARGPGTTTMTGGQEKRMQQLLLQTGTKAVTLPNTWVWHYVPRDRCSVRWTLRRMYLSGKSQGLDTPPVAGRSLGGYPSWAVRKWARKLTELLRALLSTRREKIARELFALAFQSGMVQGLRLAARHPDRH